MVYLFATATYTDQMYTLEFNEAASPPYLTLRHSFEAGKDPSWITGPHPEDKSLYFVGVETSDILLAIKYDAEGKGTIVGRGSSNADGPCSLLVIDDGKTLVCANYPTSQVSFISISATPPYIGAPTQPNVHFDGSGPNPLRQTASHPHDTKLIKRATEEGGDELLIPDLGGDQTARFLKNRETGVWEVKGYVTYPLGSGPRHVQYYDGHLYGVLECTSHLAVHALPPLATAPTPTLLITVPTLLTPPLTPPLPSAFDPFRTGHILASEIQILPPSTAFSEPYVVVANRNEGHPEGDTLSFFTTATVQEGAAKCELVTELRTSLTHIRSFCFFGPESKYLIVSGAAPVCGGARVYERFPAGAEGGRGVNWKLVAKNEDIKRATCFELLDV